MSVRSYVPVYPYQAENESFECEILYHQETAHLAPPCVLYDIMSGYITLA